MLICYLTTHVLIRNFVCPDLLQCNSESLGDVDPGIRSSLKEQPGLNFTSIILQHTMTSLASGMGVSTQWVTRVCALD